MEVLGGRLPGLLSGHGSLRTDQRATRIYRTRASQQLKASMLASTHILVFKLATARVFCSPQPTNACLPSLPALISRVSLRAFELSFSFERRSLFSSSSSHIQDSAILLPTTYLHTQAPKMLSQTIFTTHKKSHSR